VTLNTAPPGGAPSLIVLLRTYLRPYQRPLAVVLVLLLIGAIGNLYLPDLNGDIIDNGIAKGDTEYIVRVGGLMLIVTALLGVTSILAVYFGARMAMGFGRDVRSRLTKVETFSQVEVSQFGPASLIPEHQRRQQVQTVVHGPDDRSLGADPDRRGIFMALRTDVPLSALC
jgi:ATP-binding cassette subfamily B protein